MKQKPSIATCYHEAGHAVVRLLLDMPVRQVTVNSKADSLGHVRGGFLPLWLCTMIESGDPWSDAGAIKRILSEMMSSLAGGLAEKQKTRRAMNLVGSQSDRNNAIDFAFALTPKSYPKELRALWKWLELRTTRLVRTHWKAVDALAQELLLKKSLSGAEVRVVIAKADPLILPDPPLSRAERASLDQQLASWLATMTEEEIDCEIANMPPPERRRWQRVRTKLRSGEWRVTSSADSQ